MNCVVNLPEGETKRGRQTREAVEPENKRKLMSILVYLLTESVCSSPTYITIKLTSFVKIIVFTFTGVPRGNDLLERIIVSQFIFGFLCNIL
jgi:hypothetical protein